MTAQIAERLFYEVKEQAMCSEPLSSYLDLADIDSPFESNCTALWRGYVGTWEILDDRLYLVGLEGTLRDGGEASLETLFPGFPERVFAHWYSGTLRIPDGKQLEYVHMGYASTFERDILLQIERGLLVHTEIRHNGAAERPEAPEGYGIGAMTVFASKKR